MNHEQTTSCHLVISEEQVTHEVDCLSYKLFVDLILALGQEDLNETAEIVLEVLFMLSVDGQCEGCRVSGVSQFLENTSQTIE